MFYRLYVYDYNKSMVYNGNFMNLKFLSMYIKYCCWGCSYVVIYWSVGSVRKVSVIGKKQIEDYSWEKLYVKLWLY